MQSVTTWSTGATCRSRYTPDVERDCFSGQTLVEDDRVIAIYHGTRAGNGIATASDPLLINWAKHPDNPVIPGDPQGLGGGGR